MEQKGREDSASERKASEDVYQLWSVAQQLEAHRSQNPETIAALISLYEGLLQQLQPDEDPILYASIQANLGNAYSELPAENRARRLQMAIACYQQALRFLTAETRPLQYATIQICLGAAYTELPTGDRAANLQQAIACQQEALRFLTPINAPTEYAAIQINLGNAYRNQSTKSRAANLQQAIVCYQQALRFLIPKDVPTEYAFCQNNLGLAYRDLPTGDRAANLQQAIASFQHALRFRTPETDPLGYAACQNNLGLAYRDLPTGDRAANLQQAIASFQHALRFRTPETDPLGYARTQASLGLIHSDLLTGDRATNLQRAMACYQQALRFLTAQDAPFEYAILQTNLGSAYCHLPTGDREVNLTKAIACYQQALRFITSTSDPFEYARIHNGLGNAYRNLPEDRATNLARAITCYQQALRFWTAEDAPFEYAGVQTNLGNVYTELLSADLQGNLARAIACYQQALRFWTPETAPLSYALTQANLGTAYRRLTTGDANANLARAITCFQQALRFYTIEVDPFECRRTNRNLANLYFARGDWEAALSAYRVAMDAGELLYIAGLSADSKAAEIAENSALYRHAAFTAVRCGATVESLLNLDRGKTRLLSEALRLRVSRPARVPDEVWFSFESAGTAVRAAQSRMTALSGTQQDFFQDSMEQEQAIQRAAGLLNEAITQVRIYAPDFLHPIDVPAVQAQLAEEKAALVTFCITDRGSIGLVVDHQSVQAIDVLDFTQADLRRLFVQVHADTGTLDGWLVDYIHYQKAPEGEKEALLAIWQTTIVNVLAEVGQRLLAPVLRTLPPGIERIIFVPSAELFLLPLQAASLSGNDADLVCNRYLVSYAPSIEVLTETRAKASRVASPQLYALVDPTEDLAFTHREGAALARLFEMPCVHEGSMGTQRHMLDGVKGRTYVHLSCHGSYNWDDPPASGLELADGRLTLAELQQGRIDLSAARLVTLSACETGISDVTEGRAEEFVGIPAGFLLAGVPCVVSSLWAVPDFSTALLMERFYQNHLLAGMSIVAALHEAQVWLREMNMGEVATSAERWYRQAGQKGEKALFGLLRYYRSQAERHPSIRPFAHPYFWAAFTVNGM
jgi:CHAT domain-containing protein